MVAIIIIMAILFARVQTGALWLKGGRATQFILLVQGVIDLNKTNCV